MATKKVTIQEFKDIFIQTCINNGVSDKIIKEIENIYEVKSALFIRNLPYKANEIMESYIKTAYIDIKVGLINVIVTNSEDTDPWVLPIQEVINTYLVA